MIKHYYQDAQESPTWGTHLGLSECDSLLPDFSDTAMERQIKECRARLDSLLKIDTTGWSIDDQIDFIIATGDLKVTIFDANSWPWWRQSASSYASTLFNGLSDLTNRNAVSFEQNAEAFIGRMKRIPAYMKIAEANMKSVSENDGSCAIAVFGMITDLISSYSGLLIDSLPSKNAEISTIGDKAIIAVSGFRQALIDTFLRGDYTEFAYGEDYFNYFLKEYFHFNIDADSLVRLAEAEFERSDSLYKYYESLTPKEENAYSDMRFRLDVHEESINKYYLSEIEHLKTYMAERNIINGPRGFDQLKLKKMPNYIKRIGYRSDYLVTPSPLGKNQTGIFYIQTDFTDYIRYEGDPETSYISYTPKFRDSIIKRVFPGRLYLYEITHKNKYFVRRFYDDDLMKDGWVLYIREVVYQSGLFGDDYEILADYYKDLRDLALAAMIEIGMHTGRLTFETAYDYVESKLGEEAGHQYDRTSRCSCAYPLTNAYAMLSRLLILDMREKAKAREGDKFDLAKFHEKLLSEGNIPPPLIAWKYGWQ